MEKLSCLASGGVPLHVFVRAVTDTCTKSASSGLQGDLANLAIDALLQGAAAEIEGGEVGAGCCEHFCVVLSRAISPFPSLTISPPTRPQMAAEVIGGLKEQNGGAAGLAEAFKADPRFEAETRKFFRTAATRLFHILDINSDGTISWKEIENFQSAFSLVTGKMKNEEEIKAGMKAIFDIMDADGNGEFEEHELVDKAIEDKDAVLDIVKAALKMTLAQSEIMLSNPKLPYLMAVSFLFVVDRGDDMLLNA